MSCYDAKASMLKFCRERRFELLLTLYVPVDLALFFFAEAVVPTEGYWVSYLPLDDKIPFWEGGILFYDLWYPFLVGTGFFLLLRDKPAYRRFLYFIIISFTASIIFCILFPNGQNLRPEQFARDNLLTRLVGGIYAVDTNTNVFPSIHVIGACICAAAWFDSPSLRRFRWGAALLAALICISTVWVKQHSVLDILGGLAVFLPLYMIIYRQRFVSCRLQKVGS